MTTIAELDKQIAQIKQRLEEAKDTPAESIFLNVLSQLTENYKLLEQPKEEPIKEPLYFQSIGWIKASVISVKTEEGKTVYKLNYKGQEFRCDFFPKARGGYVDSGYTFRKYVADKGEMILAVYPRYTHFPEKDKEPDFKFEVFSWGNKPDNRELDKFYINGIWQFIAVYRRPVVSVYRNQSRFEKDLLKANHCPVFWKNSIVKPFRFNPKEETQGDKYFVQTVCRFDQRTISFVVDDVISCTDQIPKYKKPVKVQALPKNKKGKNVK